MPRWVSLRSSHPSRGWCSALQVSDGLQQPVTGRPSLTRRQKRGPTGASSILRLRESLRGLLPLQRAFLAIRELHLKLRLDIRLGRSTRLTVRDDRIGDDADVLPVLVLLGPVDVFEARQTLVPVVLLHHLRAQAAQRT